MALVCLQVANFASFSSEQTSVLMNNGMTDDHHKPSINYNSLPTAVTIAPSPVANEFTARTTTSAQQNDTNNPTSVQERTSTIGAATTDPNADPDEMIVTSTASNGGSGLATIQPPWQPNKELPDKVVTNKSKPVVSDQAAFSYSGSLDLNVLFYSIFIVYVSFIKLIYHNVTFIKRNMTEPG